MNDSGFDAEFGKHLSHVFEIQRWETERDTPATQEWFQLIANTNILARMLQDENTDPDVNAELATAISVFETAMAEFSAYLEEPAPPAAITEFVQRVENRLHNTNSV
jgi:hypothetical protein